jgi:4-hydroxy-3-polyprenylbenzoate decarboxylase
MNVFLGITGASGAPYAARLLDALVAADVEVGLCASSAGLEVVATELYGDPDLDRDEVLRRFVGDRAGVTVHAPDDWRAPYASGSAKVDAYVICPCSMGTAGTIASGTMSNLIHRAASVAIKEGRKLIVVPRETPLSDIHLENLLRLRRAGAVVLIAAPGFYNAPQSIDDLIEFVVGRCLDQLEIENRLTKRWGQE